MSNPNRQSAGQPIGGQFATEAKGTDTGVDLGAPRPRQDPEFDADTVHRLVDEAWSALPSSARRSGADGLLGRMDDVDDAGGTGLDPRLDRLLRDTVCMDTAPRAHSGEGIDGTTLSETNRQAVLDELGRTSRPVAAYDVHNTGYVHHSRTDWDRVCTGRASDAFADGEYTVAATGSGSVVRTPFGRWEDHSGDRDGDALVAALRDGDVGEDVEFVSAY